MPVVKRPMNVVGGGVVLDEMIEIKKHNYFFFILPIISYI